MNSGDDSPGYAVNHGYKDLSLALQFASELETVLPVVAGAGEVYGLARLLGKSEKHTGAVFQLYTETSE